MREEQREGAFVIRWAVEVLGRKYCKDNGIDPRKYGL
jgi:hypothetical protein